MPQAGSVAAIPRPDLFDTFIEYDAIAGREGLIGPQVLPFFDTPLKATTFRKVELAELMKDIDFLRAPGGEYMRDTHKVVSDTYTCKEFGKEEAIDDSDSALFKDYFDVEAIAANRALLQLLRAYEVRVAAKVFDTAVWTGAALTTAVSNAWLTASGTPVADIMAAQKKVRASCGFNANSLVIGVGLFEDLQTNAEVIERIKYSGHDDPKNVTLDALAALFHIDRVLVGGMTKVGSTSSTTQDIWADDKAMLCRINMGADLRAMGIGRTFHWTADGSSQLGAVESYRDEKVRSDIIRVRHHADEKVIYEQAGHLLTGC